MHISGSRVMLKLQFKDLRQESIWLVNPRFTIGRDKVNDLVIDEEGIAGFHAELSLDEGKVYLADLGSDEGTYVNNQKVSDKQELHPWDTIKMNHVILEIIDPKQSHDKKSPDPEEKTKKNIKLSSGWSLVTKREVVSVSEYAISMDSEFDIGRDSKCTISIPDASVSRQHARFNMRSGVLRVVDLGSANGTLVNGETVHEKRLHPGDLIKIGDVEFKVCGPMVDVGKTRVMSAIDAADLARTTEDTPGNGKSAMPGARQEIANKNRVLEEAKRSIQKPAMTWWEKAAIGGAVIGLAILAYAILV